MDNLTPAQICQNFSNAIRSGNLEEAIKWKDRIIESKLTVEDFLFEDEINKKNKIKKKNKA